jgi:uncharacterized protein (TIGR00299 family) protein
MKTAYGDLIGGLSGDMFVAALLDLGLPLNKLRAELKKIPTLDFALKTQKKSVHAVRATQFQVICPKREAPRSWKQIRRLIERSRLSATVKATGLEIFSGLARAEAKIHGDAVDDVHFHEVGATDSIVDIMASAIGVHALGIESLAFSPIPLGRAIVRSMHGPLPAPGPATLELLRGLPVVGVPIESETVTPTGAAIVKTLGQSFGAQPPMILERIGYGAGHKEFAGRPNLFRLLVGRAAPASRREPMLVLETNIDDMNPQFYDHVMERLFRAGARDVFLAPIQMKKNRPATLLSVIAERADGDKLAAILFQETSTIGVRCYPVERMVLQRENKKIKTRFGELAVKIVELPDGSKRITPEYDELKKLAAAKKLPLKRIYDAVMGRLDS